MSFLTSQVNNSTDLNGTGEEEIFIGQCLWWDPGSKLQDAISKIKGILADWPYVSSITPPSV